MIGRRRESLHNERCALEKEAGITPAPNVRELPEAGG
jgi:hypothetical protein